MDSTQFGTAARFNLVQSLGQEMSIRINSVQN